MNIAVKKSFLKGTIHVPGDKSISHRAVMLGAIARGKTEIKNFLDSEDTFRTIEAFRQMGVKIKSVKVSKCQDNRKKKLIIEGKGLYLKKPKGIIDAGNSGTTMRMLAGILAGQSFNSCITGDESLRSRPMHRIIIPLRRMGAQIKARQDNYAPLYIRGETLKSLPSPYKMEIASAQLKSCLLFAHLYTNRKIELDEPARSRDHTERMLEYFGTDIEVKGRHIFLNPGSSLSGKPVSVPGDISSAAFFMVGAIITEGSKIFIKKVGINPTRSEILSVLKRMGADIKLSNKSMESGEPVADILITPSRLKGISIRGKSIPLLIDEIPILVVAATQARGRTVIQGAAELRVKETDRIKSMATGLKKMGADIMELKDGMVINGPTRLKGVFLDSYGDHRTAMAFVIAGLIADGQTIVENAECINTSFPGFVETLRNLGANVKLIDSRHQTSDIRQLVIAIDGPAGSGKSTVAKEIAKRLGYAYLDTGAMYRAITLKAMKNGIDMRDPESLTELAEKTKISFKAGKVLLDGKDVSAEIRNPEVSNNAHFISVVSGVREKMKVLQRQISNKGGIVAEGRDMGTVVFPDADRKFYLDARPEVRAKRRFRELKEKGFRTTFKKILQDTIRRDKKDSEREIAPLRKAEDAILIDTTNMTIQEVVEVILKKIIPKYKISPHSSPRLLVVRPTWSQTSGGTGH